MQFDVVKEKKDQYEVRYQGSSAQIFIQRNFIYSAEIFIRSIICTEHKLFSQEPTILARFAINFSPST